MDINEELNNLNNPGFSLPKVQKSTYEDYDKVICNRLKRIKGELYMLYQELSQDEPDEKVIVLWNTIHDFSSSELSALHDVLKEKYYFNQYFFYRDIICPLISGIFSLRILIQYVCQCLWRSFMANKDKSFPNGEVREDTPQSVIQADRDLVNSLESKKKEGNDKLIYVKPAE